MINLSGMENKLPESLSGGEQQRAAIAVAIANQPLLLLADEPTGELDSETAQMIIGLLSRMTREQGLTTILVTHDPAAAARADRTVVIRDGRLSSETVRLATPIGSGSMERSSDARLASAIASRPPLTEEAMREVLLLDSAGRLQLREETLEYLDFQGKAALHLAPDHVELWPMRTSGQVREPAASPVPSSDIIESFVGLPDAGRLVAVLIDAKGRLQLPQAALDLIPFGRHITALVADGHIELWPFAAQRTPEPNTDTDIHASGRPSGQEAGSDGR
jgi:energy-coupling factor transporter ATP-binding protein EcfA2